MGRVPPRMTVESEEEEGDTGAFPGDPFLPEEPQACFHSMTWVNPGRLQGLSCAPVSEAVRLGLGPDRECFQVSGSAPAGKELGTVF